LLTGGPFPPDQDCQNLDPLAPPWSWQSGRNVTAAGNAAACFRLSTGSGSSKCIGFAMRRALSILAAGEEKADEVEEGQGLAQGCGQPMIRYVVDAAWGAGAETIVVAVGCAIGFWPMLPARPCLASPTSPKRQSES
jgi:hypothetical protein